MLQKNSRVINSFEVQRLCRTKWMKRKGVENRVNLAWYGNWHVENHFPFLYEFKSVQFISFFFEIEKFRSLVHRTFYLFLLETTLHGDYENRWLIIYRLRASVGFLFKVVHNFEYRWIIMALKLHCVVIPTDEIRRHTFRLLKQKVSLREHNLKFSPCIIH